MWLELLRCTKLGRSSDSESPSFAPKLQHLQHPANSRQNCQKLSSSEDCDWLTAGFYGTTHGHVRSCETAVFHRLCECLRRYLGKGWGGPAGLLWGCGAEAYGGVYADIDVEATRCFDPLLQAAQNARMAVLLGEAPWQGRL